MTSELKVADLANLPVVMDLITAGQILGISRTTAYQLAKDGQFPCRVLKIGRRYLVPTCELLALLGYHDGLRRPDVSER
ncbi:helix-turn-helix transcriptional regulator [Planomonospora parontospora]|uniref:helix-turn-helix transcriptional regulator n=1 Tax=Planomonospora parontospora TaxID=58119 RepID=UPI0019BA9E09|nr:helix-turn-helix domain-containing protein [Planomonospora parontospora]GGL42649.1 hypothetical protein GCM10014719_49960 [Planomonospora parontospora subsp. antibiotica]GII18365.1 hypothetical protein Ppa05_50910 [Planomonospora parontospora subsp. antibiotica]